MNNLFIRVVILVLVFNIFGYSKNIKEIIINQSSTYPTELVSKKEIRTFKGHIGSVSSLVISPNGKYILSGSDDKTVKLWDINTGKLIRTFKTGNKVVSVAISPNGKYVLSGGKSLKLWNINTGKLIRTFKGHKYKIMSVAISPNGKYVISGSDDKTLKLWDINTGKLIRTFKGHKYKIMSVAISPNGKYVISGNRSIKLWDMYTGELIRTFQGHLTEIISIIMPNGKYVLSGSPENLKLQNIKTGELIKTFQGGFMFIVSVAMTPNGKYVFAGGWFGNMKIWNIKTGELIRTFKHKGPASSTVISLNGKYVFSGSNDHIIRIFNLFPSFNEVFEIYLTKELQNIKKPISNLTFIKGEFETTSNFKTRVARTNKKQKILISEYKRKVSHTKSKTFEKNIKKSIETIWGKPIIKNLKYDADNGYFIADLSFEKKDDFNKQVAIKVPLKNAKNFKNNFKDMKVEAIFSYDLKSVALKNVRVLHKNKKIIAHITDMKIDDMKVVVNLSNDFDDGLSVSSNIKTSDNSMKKFDSSKLKDYQVLDRLLDKSPKVKIDKKKWLFVIGIEQYEYTDNIAFASRSANMFIKVMQKKLGIKQSQTYKMIDSGATQAKIKTSLKKMLRRIKKGDTIYFYYNGHGIPVANKKFEPYILTSDSEPDYVSDESFFALKNIYGKLSSSKASKVIAVVDSCFSGVTDGKGILKGVGATRMKPRGVSFDKDKMVLLVAGKSHQFSNGYNAKGHRLFSFYIMKNILEGKKTIKGLYRETKKQTYQTSIEEYGDVRTQEPTMMGNFRLKL